MNGAMVISGDDLNLQRRQHCPGGRGAERRCGSSGRSRSGRSRSLRIARARFFVGGHPGLSNRLWCWICGDSGSRLLRLILCLLRVGKPKITIPIEHESESDEKQRQSDDHHAPLRPFVEIPGLRAVWSVTVDFSNECLELKHTGTQAGLKEASAIVCLEKRRKASKSGDPRYSEGPTVNGGYPS